MDPQESDYALYMEFLKNAHTSAQKALDLLYKPSGVKRGWWHRITLGRAQNLLMTLYMRELNQEVRNNDQNS